MLEEEALFPYVSAGTPRVPLEDKEQDFQVVTDEPEPYFEDFVAAALKNAGINAAGCLWAARAASDAAAVKAALPYPPDGPRLIEANLGKIDYEVTLVLPNTGLPAHATDEQDASDTDTAIQDNTTNNTTTCPYPTQSHRE